MNHPGNRNRENDVGEVKGKLNHRRLGVIQLEMGNQRRQQDVVHAEECSNHEKHQRQQHQGFILVFHIDIGQDFILVLY